MTAPATCEEFLDLVRRSEVLDSERLESFAQVLSSSDNSSHEPRQIAERMVRDGLLTAFQAKQLLIGKWRRFRISGKYKLLELIGAGGMGSVYLCEHVFMRRHVALKVLPLEKLSDESSLARFYREARAVGKLDHPNIVRAYDIDQDDKLHFLVMEYVDGASLQDIVSRHGPLSPAAAANYIRQAALGLQHAHEAGLVQRDVKPGNLLLDRAGVVKVLDLGLARFFNDRKDNLTERYDDDATLGTADYLAPEQANNKLDIRSDIYSLGVTFYFLLVGKAPFEDGKLTQKLLWHQVKKIPSVLEHRKDVPAEMAAIIEKMVQKSPEDRYATPKEVAEALAPWADKPLDPPPAAWMPKRSLAALTPGAQGDAPVLPITPPPRSSVGRSVPMPRSVNSTPAPKSQLPPTVAPRATPARGGPRPSGRRTQSAGPSRGKIIAMIAGGSAISLGLIFGIVYALVGKRDDRALSAAPSAGPYVVVPQAAPQLPPAAPSATLSAQPPRSGSNKVARPIRAEEAKNHLGEYCLVEMTVRRTGKNQSTRFFLNSMEDFRDPNCFTVTFERPVFEQLKARGLTDLDSFFLNRTIKVRGTITKYINPRDQSKSIQIEVEDASQILGP